MNKLTVTLIIGLMSCALCGCMSEQEWNEWNQKRDQEHTEWLFSMHGVAYPGTREAYIKSHALCTKEDVKVFFKYNAEKFVIGSLNRDDFVEDTDLEIPYLFEEKFDMEWSLRTAEEQKEMSRLSGEMYNNIISLKGFMRGTTLEQLRVSLQVPLETEYVSLHSAMYSWSCEAPNYSTDCTVHFTFIDDRLDDWTKIYSPHISEPTYIPSLYYDKKY